MTHILVIEDDSYSQDVLAMFFEQLNISQTNISTAKNIQELLQTLDKVDLIFLDLEFGDLSGYDVINIIRSSENLRDTPVVAYTSHTNEMNRARDLGFAGFISKPVSAENFAADLATLLRGESVWN